MNTNNFKDADLVRFKFSERGAIGMVMCTFWNPRDSNFHVHVMLIDASGPRRSSIIDLEADDEYLEVLQRV